jgi:hypothetical protein
MIKRPGTERTRRYYDEEGWHSQDGDSVDHNLFGLKEDGPIRVELRRLNTDRIHLALDLPRFRGEVRSWDQGIWFDGILSSSFE